MRGLKVKDWFGVLWVVGVDRGGFCDSVYISRITVGLASWREASIYFHVNTCTLRDFGYSRGGNLNELRAGSLYTWNLSNNQDQNK